MAKYLNPVDSNDEETFSSRDNYLIAYYKPNPNVKTHTIQYKTITSDGGNGGYVTNDNDTWVGSKGGNISGSTAKKNSGYEFGGWVEYTDSEHKNFIVVSSSAHDYYKPTGEQLKDTTYYALFYKDKGSTGGYVGYNMNLSDVKVTWNGPTDWAASSGSGAPMYYSNNQYSTGEEITLSSDNIPSADGYAFIGWFDKDRPSGNDYKRNATLYSKAEVEAGKKIRYPYGNNARFTLEALWAGIQTTHLKVPYDGGEHSITATKFYNAGTIAATGKDANTVKRYKDEIDKLLKEENFKITDTFFQVYNEDGSLGAEEHGSTFTRKEPGNYKVKVTAYASINGSPVTLTQDTYLIIYPASVTINKIWVDWYNETGIRPDEDHFTVYLNQGTNNHVSVKQATGRDNESEPIWIPEAVDKWSKTYEDVIVRPDVVYGANDETSNFYDYTADEVVPTYYTKLSETRVVSEDKLSTEITIVNRIKKHPIEFIKHDEANSVLNGAKFTITMIENARFDDDNASADDKKPNKNLTWEIEIGDKTVDLYEGFYKIEETAAPKGFGKIADQYFTVKNGKVTLTDKDKKALAVSAISIDNTNTERSTFIIRDGRAVNITLKKVDKSNVGANPTTLLDGATFKIEKYTSLKPLNKDTTWNNEHSAESSGNGGVFTFSALPIGYYQIVETNMPAGYVKLADNPIFEVAADSTAGALEIFLLDEKGKHITGNKTDMLVVSGDTIVVGNEPGVALPSTGGSGTYAFYIVGAVLTLAAGIALVARRKKAA